MVPERFGISSGFLITSQGSISTQCDIIIYDRHTTPKIENIDNQRFFPIETVSCIGEVKSDINSIGELNGHLVKLSAIKALRDEVACPEPYFRKSFDGNPFSPTSNSFDNVFSFLICNRFRFDLGKSVIDYGGVPQRFKHNLVMSLNDGLLTYFRGEIPNVAMPFTDTAHGDSFVRTDGEDLPQHILSFLTALHTAINMTTLLDMDFVRYLTDDLTETIT